MRALVTGAAKRIGRAMAIKLAEEGYDVAIHYSGSATAAEDTAQEIRDMGRNSCAVQADLLDLDQTESLVPRAVEQLGGHISVLINNASTFEDDSVATATRTSWDRSMASNLRAPFILTQAVARDIPNPVMDDMNEPVAQGLVINMIDQRVRKLTPAFMTYTLAKSALWTFTKTAAQDLAPRVRVNGIGPGPTLVAEKQSDDNFAKQRARTILKRGSNPGDITAAVSYFLHAPAVTGQLLCVDGGQHLGWQTPDIIGLD